VADIEDFRRLIAGDHGLVVVSTLRDNGTIASSVVNAGVLPHPLTGETVVGMVFRGGIRKLGHLRKRPYANVVVRSGWQWAAAEGRTELAGPDDPMDGIDAERLRHLRPGDARGAAHRRLRAPGPRLRQSWSVVTTGPFWMISMLC
jgi:hypothetical protein